MTAPESHWRALGDQVEELGRKLRSHLSTADTSEVSDALDKLGRTVRDAFDAAGQAVRDEAVRSDVRDVGRLFADAVSATFNRAKADIRGDTWKDATAHSPADPKPIADAKPGEDAKPIADAKPGEDNTQ
jgi:hypothetical protein